MRSWQDALRQRADDWTGITPALFLFGPPWLTSFISQEAALILGNEQRAGYGEEGQKMASRVTQAQGRDCSEMGMG